MDRLRRTVVRNLKATIPPKHDLGLAHWGVGGVGGRR
jgi:hypothetical protein